MLWTSRNIFLWEIIVVLIEGINGLLNARGQIPRKPMRAKVELGPVILKSGNVLRFPEIRQENTLPRVFPKQEEFSNREAFQELQNMNNVEDEKTMALTNYIQESEFESPEQESQARESREREYRAQESWERESRARETLDQKNKKEESRAREYQEGESRARETPDRKNKREKSRAREYQEGESRARESRERKYREGESGEREHREGESRARESREREYREQEHREGESRAWESRDGEHQEEESRERESRERKHQEGESRDRKFRERETREKETREQVSRERKFREWESQEQEYVEKNDLADFNPLDTDLSPMGIQKFSESDERMKERNEDDEHVFVNTDVLSNNNDQSIDWDDIVTPFQNPIDQPQEFISDSDTAEERDEESNLARIDNDKDPIELNEEDAINPFPEASLDIPQGEEVENSSPPPLSTFIEDSNASEMMTEWTTLPSESITTNPKRENSMKELTFVVNAGSKGLYGAISDYFNKFREDNLRRQNPPNLDPPVNFDSQSENDDKSNSNLLKGQDDEEKSSDDDDYVNTSFPLEVGDEDVTLDKSFPKEESSQDVLQNKRPTFESDSDADYENNGEKSTTLGNTFDDELPFSSEKIENTPPPIVAEVESGGEMKSTKNDMFHVKLPITTTSSQDKKFSETNEEKNETLPEDYLLKSVEENAYGDLNSEKKENDFYLQTQKYLPINSKFNAETDSRKPISEIVDSTYSNEDISFDNRNNFQKLIPRSQNPIYDERTVLPQRETRFPPIPFLDKSENLSREEVPFSSKSFFEKSEKLEQEEAPFSKKSFFDKMKNSMPERLPFSLNYFPTLEKHNFRSPRLNGVNEYSYPIMTSPYHTVFTQQRFPPPSYFKNREMHLLPSNYENGDFFNDNDYDEKRASIKPRFRSESQGHEDGRPQRRVTQDDFKERESEVGNNSSDTSYASYESGPDENDTGKSTISPILAHCFKESDSCIETRKTLCFLDCSTKLIDREATDKFPQANLNGLINIMSNTLDTFCQPLRKTSLEFKNHAYRKHDETQPNWYLLFGGEGKISRKSAFKFGNDLGPYIIKNGNSHFNDLRPLFDDIDIARMNFSGKDFLRKVNSGFDERECPVTEEDLVNVTSKLVETFYKDPLTLDSMLPGYMTFSSVAASVPGPHLKYFAPLKTALDKLLDISCGLIHFAHTKEHLDCHFTEILPPQPTYYCKPQIKYKYVYVYRNGTLASDMSRYTTLHHSVTIPH